MKLKYVIAVLLLGSTLMMAACDPTLTHQECVIHPTSHQNEDGVIINGKSYIVTGCKGIISPYDDSINERH